ncbi:MAG: RecX family transcriptional regulator [Tannerella sp.]|nr:RecX family transcriptional regulator [Tannerella sp.]
MKQKNEPELLRLAAAYCSAAERCIYDVRKKVTSHGGSAAVAERIIAYLVKEQFIDESRFCRSFVSDKFRFNRWGRIKINSELRKKEIAPALIEEALGNIDEESYAETLQELLKSKQKTVRSRNEQDLFGKLYRFAAGRGFEQHVIANQLRLLLKNNDDAAPVP